MSVTDYHVELCQAFFAAGGQVGSIRPPWQRSRMVPRKRIRSLRSEVKVLTATDTNLDISEFGRGRDSVRFMGAALTGVQIGMHGLVARDLDGRLLGVSAAKWRNRQRRHLDVKYLGSAMRVRGTGATLIASAALSPQSNACLPVRVDSVQDAIPFYERLGFKHIRDLRPGPLTDHVVYEMELAAPLVEALAKRLTATSMASGELT